MKKERKNKIMDGGSSISFWKVAVGILVAALLIGVIFLVARQGKTVANEKLEGITGMMSEYQDETYAMYDNMEVSGAEIRNVIERTVAKGDEVCIRVFTKAGAYTDYVKKAAGEATSKTFDGIIAGVGETSVGDDKSNASYINPSAVFEGKVMRNANGVLVGLVFEQK